MEEDLKQEWLSKILKELGSDFELKKFQEGSKSGSWIGRQLINADKIRQELNKVLLPEFMYDWVFECQLLRNFCLIDALDSNTIHLYAKKSESVKKWIDDKNNQELFARAWIDDYELEKESKYRVKLKNTDDYLNETEVGFHFYNNWENNKTFTRKELEYSDFSWVLDCPGIELEEVKNE